MLLSDLRLGRPLEVYINRDGYNYRVISKIEYTEPGCVCVSLIAGGKRVFQFLETDIIDIVYQEQDRMWKWSNVKGAVVAVEEDKMHGFFSDEAGANYNRRNAFRMYLGKELLLRYKVTDKKRLQEADEKDKEKQRHETYYKYDKKSDEIMGDRFKWIECLGFIRDISELGVGIYSNEKFMPDDEIAFEFVTDAGKIECRAIIVRMRDHVNGAFHNYYGCRFIETSRNLTKYLYEQQRIQLQNANNYIKRN